MTEKPDSVMRHEKFQDLMKRYHGQMENALYAAEQTCPGPSGYMCHLCDFISHNADTHCALLVIREHLGDYVQQHDIQIPDDNTPFERKMKR